MERTSYPRNGWKVNYAKVVTYAIRKTGIEVKGNVAKDIDNLENIDDFFQSSDGAQFAFSNLTYQR